MCHQWQQPARSPRPQRTNKTGLARQHRSVTLPVCPVRIGEGLCRQLPRLLRPHCRTHGAMLCPSFSSAAAATRHCARRWARGRLREVQSTCPLKRAVRIAHMPSRWQCRLWGCPLGHPGFEVHALPISGGNSRIMIPAARAAVPTSVWSVLAESHLGLGIDLTPGRHWPFG